MSCRPVTDGLLSWGACLSALRGAHAQTQLALWDREVPLGAKCCDLFSLGVASSPACCPSLSAVVALRPILESIFRFFFTTSLIRWAPVAAQTDQDVQTELAWWILVTGCLRSNPPLCTYWLNLNCYQAPMLPPIPYPGLPWFFLS